MAVTKAKKIEQVEELSQELAGASHAIVGTFAKLTVEKDFELRKAVRGAGAKYRVVKNTLAERASKGSKVEEVMQGLGRRYFDCVHQRRPGCSGESSQQVRQGQSGIHLQGGHRRWPRHRDQGH